MKDAETGQRVFLLTGNELLLQPYTKSEMLVRSAFDMVRVLTADNGAQQAEWSGLKRLIDAKFELVKNTIAQNKQGGLVSTEVLLMGKSYMDRTRTTITRMENMEEILLAVRLATSKLDGTITRVSIILAFLISLASTIFFYNRTVKNYSGRLRLEQYLLDESVNLERRIALLKSHSERIGDGDMAFSLMRISCGN